MRVRHMNPSNESRKVGNAEIANDTIFRHLREKQGFSIHKLESMIPVRSDNPLIIAAWCQLGTLYNESVYLDHDGRFQFGDVYIAPPRKTVEIEEERGCKHSGFVVRDIQGENRFLCRECYKRFPRHPAMMPKIQTMQAPMEDLMFTLGQFRQGMITFTSAIQTLGGTLEEFKETLTTLFPPKKIYTAVETLGNGHTAVCDGPYEVFGADQDIYQAGEEPQRTSCPKEVEEYFGDTDVTLDNTTPGISYNEMRFNDVVEVSHSRDAVSDKTIVHVGFVDDTIQKVIVSDDHTVRMLGKRVLNYGSLSKLLPPPNPFSGECQ